MNVTWSKSFVASTAEREASARLSKSLRRISGFSFIDVQPAYARRGISQSHSRKLFRQWASRTKPPELFPRFLPFNATFK